MCYAPLVKERTMKLSQRRSSIEKIKDCIVDGCLLYDGVVGLLLLGIAFSLVLTYGAIELT
jgi:hypothetical protein